MIVRAVIEVLKVFDISCNTNLISALHGNGTYWMAMGAIVMCGRSSCSLSPHILYTSAFMGLHKENPERIKQELF